MGINSPITWGVNWPNNGGLLQQKRGSRAGCGPRVAYCRRGRLRTQSYSDSRLKWDTRFLRLASEVKRQVTQARALPETQSYSDSRWNWDARFLRPASAKLLRPALNVSLLMPASEVFMLLWTRRPRFSLKRDLRVEVRFASDDLSLVIFGQLTCLLGTQVTYHAFTIQIPVRFSIEAMGHRRKKVMHDSE